MHTEIILSLGSNINGRENVVKALDILGRFLSDVRCSAVIQTQAVEFTSSASFSNAVLQARTTLPYHALRSVIKGIEKAFGRTPERKLRRIIDLDIDILMYGSRMHKPDDWRRTYNQVLLRSLGIIQPQIE